MNRELTAIALPEVGAPTAIAAPRVAATARARERSWNTAVILAAVSLSTFLVVHIVFALVRRLSFDEAYYLVAARRSIPWSIDDHPPLLGVLLALSDQIFGLPVELRVRAAAIVMQLVAAVGLGRVAMMLVRPALGWRAFAIAVTLATWGLIPAAGGSMVFPDAPFFAALAWLLFFAVRSTRPAGDGPARKPVRDVAARPEIVVGLFVTAALALASKASAVPCLAAVTLGLLAAGQRRGALAVAGGTLVVMPLAVRSLWAQTAHVLGMGPFVSQPRIGSLLSLVIIVVATTLVFGPPVIYLGLRSRALRAVPGARLMVLFIAAAMATSALVAGRIPEVHWFVPASVPLYVGAAVALAGASSRARAWVIAAHALPAVAGCVLWAVPIRAVDAHLDFFAAAPHVAFAPLEPSLSWIAGVANNRSVPAYGEHAWWCVYGAPAARNGAHGGDAASLDPAAVGSQDREQGTSPAAAAACRWLADPAAHAAPPIRERAASAPRDDFALGGAGSE